VEVKVDGVTTKIYETREDLKRLWAKHGRQEEDIMRRSVNWKLEMGRQIDLVSHVYRKINVSTVRWK
jgi:hypothetical protein